MNRILIITNAYPSRLYPDKGTFNKVQIDSLRTMYEVEVIAVTGKLVSYIKTYVRLIFLRKSDYKIVHFQHGLTYLMYRVLFLRRTVFCSFQNELEFEYLKDNHFVSDGLVYMTRVISKIFKDVYIFKGIQSKVYGKTLTLSNGVDTNIFKKVDQTDARLKLNLSLDKRYALFVSSKDLWRRQKRYDLFRDALADQRVDFVPLVASGLTQHELSLYINASDVVVVSSDYEGSANIIKESIACSTNVITTNVGDSYRYREKEYVTIVPKGDTDGLIAALRAFRHVDFDGENEIKSLGLTNKQIANKLKSIYGLQS